ncbi:MAG: hypothetical protein QOI63_837 [Thermoplasmata archaeon]|jgi:hypothetical protein|nr:hypothetical protein [Thermoplasmata archaeon]
MPKAGGAFPALVLENPLFVALASAVGGAVFGALGTALVQRHQARERDGRLLREKIHQMEMRILRLEIEQDIVDRAGERKVDGPGGDLDA